MHRCSASADNPSLIHHLGVLMKDFFKNLRIGEIIEFQCIPASRKRADSHLWRPVIYGGTLERKMTDDEFEILFPQTTNKTTVSNVASRIKLMLTSWNQGLCLSGMSIVATRAFTKKETNLPKSVAWLNGENDDESSWSQNVYKVQFEVYPLKEE